MLDIKNELIEIRKKGLFRNLKTLESENSASVTVDGRKVLLLCSNDYLGLSFHPRLKARASEVAQLWGAGTCSSRLISGNIFLYNELERKLAGFKKTQASLVFSTGYMANLGILTALAGKNDCIYSDSLNHASIIDGCRLSRADVEIYPHRDTEALDKLLKKGSGFRRRVIVSDSVFSMDGTIAPLDELYEVAKARDALLIVDDAHGTGVLGSSGRGGLEYFNLQGRSDIIIMGTLGKAMGCFGAFVACTEEIRDYLINRSRSLIYTTALPPSVIASASEAIDIIIDEPERVAGLKNNALFLREKLIEKGFETEQAETPIIPLIVHKPETATQMSDLLFEEGFFIQAVRPPSVPEGSSRLRITVMSEHTLEQLSGAADALYMTGRKFGVV